MSVVSRPARQKSWQLAGKIVSLLDAVDLDAEQLTAKLRALARAHPDVKSDEDAARLIGVSYRQYQRWLAGESTPRGSTLKRIAAAYGVPLAELLGEPAKSQLDRIEGMLAELLAREVSPEEEADRLQEEAAAAVERKRGEAPPRSAGGARAKPSRGRGARRAR